MLLTGAIDVAADVGFSLACIQTRLKPSQGPAGDGEIRLARPAYFSCSLKSRRPNKTRLLSVTGKVAARLRHFRAHFEGVPYY